jgi:hypothetical protein
MSAQEHCITPFERIERDANARWFHVIRGGQHAHTSSEAYDAAAQAQRNGEALPYLDEDDPAIYAAVRIAADEHDRIEAERRAYRIAHMTKALLRGWWAA